MNTFDGDRGCAEARLRRLTERAISSLSTERLNLASYHLAAYIDVDLQTRENTGQMSDELDSERTELEAWWNNKGSRLIP